MQPTPLIGLVGSDGRLARAAARFPGWSVQPVAVDEPASATLAGLVVDVPLEHRADMLERLVARYRVPILTESPVASAIERARALQTRVAVDTLVAANPLRYALQTRRLLESLAPADDPLQSYFAAWRFRREAPSDHALPQLLDYLRAVCPERVDRVAAMHHAQPSLWLVTLRYASGALGSLEVGTHLPDDFPSPDELVVECFGTSSAYVCLPGKQAVSLYARGAAAYEWQPDPAEAIVDEFAAWLSGGARPPGDIASDVASLTLAARFV